MRKLFVIFFTGLILSVMVIPAGADPGAKSSGGKHHKFCSSLKLTEDQKARIKSLRMAFLKDIKPLRDQAFAKRGELELLWLESSPDQDKILAAQGELRSIKGKIQDRAILLRLAILPVLTPEQRDKFKALMMHRHPHRWHMHHALG
jgi:Spy/CpxP family protein refolding chaperone